MRVLSASDNECTLGAVPKSRFWRLSRWSRSLSSESSAEFQKFSEDQNSTWNNLSDVVFRFSIKKHAKHFHRIQLMTWASRGNLWDDVKSFVDAPEFYIFDFFVVHLEDPYSLLIVRCVRSLALHHRLPELCYRATSPQTLRRHWWSSVVF